ncbi:MAG: hypothetical protein EHM45_01820 [Desulfobacteraceae bacterium]|nr:MAG: hypothetical protein EHM45_01820 [Desulfobacteraceae bacterium]
MHKIKILKEILWPILVTLAVVLSARADFKPAEFFVFTNEPLVETFKGYYPEVEEFYESDAKLVFIAPSEYQKPEKYLVKVQLQNANGIKIYEGQGELNAKYALNQSFLYYPLYLDKEVKAKLAPGMVTARLYVDGRPYAPKQLKYNPESIINRNYNQVVILPFYSTGNRIWDYKARREILNTFADAIHCEVKRVIPATVNPYDSAQKIAGLDIRKCFKDPACLKHLRDTYGEGLFITGDVDVMNAPILRNIGVNKGGALGLEIQLEVLVVNSKTWEIKKFRYAFNPVSLTVEEAIKNLIKNVLYKEGLLAHIRGLM